MAGGKDSTKPCLPRESSIGLGEFPSIVSLTYGTEIHKVSGFQKLDFALTSKQSGSSLLAKVESKVVSNKNLALNAHFLDSFKTIIDGRTEGDLAFN